MVYKQVTKGSLKCTSNHMLLFFSDIKNFPKFYLYQRLTKHVYGYKNLVAFFFSSFLITGNSPMRKKN